MRPSAWRRRAWRSPPASQERRGDAEHRRAHGDRGRAPGPRQVARGDHRIRREPVDLGIVEQEEERAEAADAVIRVGAVELSAVPALGLELLEPRTGALA